MDEATCSCIDHERLIRAIDRLLIVLLGDSIYVDNRVASCNKARDMACGSDAIASLFRRRAELAEHRLAGLGAFNADLHAYISDLHARLGIDDNAAEWAARTVRLDRQVIASLERERDMWRERALRAEMRGWRDKS